MSVVKSHKCGRTDFFSETCAPCVHHSSQVRFFGGFLTEAALTRKMNRLLGVPELEEADEGTPLARSPPWIWCCLKSFYMDKYDPWGSRRYRIFGTEIRD
jgi:hypothetical protein